jgi:drug/metabolite transporter (DMT)-like permease
MRFRQAAQTYGALIAAMLIWGFSYLATKELLPTVPVLPLLFVRFGIATVFLAGLGFRRKVFRLSKRDLALLFGLSLLSPVGYFLFETYGVSLTQASHVSVIIATIPIAVYVIAFLRRQERVTWRKTIGVVLASLGIAFLIDSSRGETGASLTGDLLVLGAVACASIQTVLLKEALRRISPLQFTFYQAAFSLVVFGPLAATEGFHGLAGLKLIGWGELLFLGVFCSAVAFLAMNYALKHLSATRVAVSVNLIPVVTLIAEATLLGVLLTSAKLAGTLIVVAGVLIAQLPRPRPELLESRTGG